MLMLLALTLRRKLNHEHVSDLWNGGASVSYTHLDVYKRQVVHLFDAPGRIDKESGQIDDDKPKVQIMGEVPQRNGQVKFELVSLSCHNPADFSEFLGQRVTVPLGISVSYTHLDVYKRQVFREW